MIGQLPLTYAPDRLALAQQMRELVAAWNDLPADDPQEVSIRGAEDVAAVLGVTMYGLEQEELHVVLLNTKNQALRIVPLYRGSVNSSGVRVAELFREAIRYNATAVILAHNHPSGVPKPSPEDVTVTRLAVAAGKLLDIEVLDHVIVGRDRHVSLREQRLGFDD